MNIIGFSLTKHDDSICLIEDNILKNHYQLERYSRIKKNVFDRSNKKLSIQYKNVNFILKDILKKDSIIATSLVTGYNNKKNKYFIDKILKKDLEIPKKIEEKANKFNNFKDYIYIKEKNIYYIDHHQAHSAYSYYTSNFEEADMLAYDGYGYRYQSTFTQSNGNILNTGRGSENPDFFIGQLWSYLSRLTTGKNFKDGTIMALAAYGNVSEKILKIFEDAYEHAKIGYPSNKFFEEENNYDFVFFSKLINKNIQNTILDVMATLQYYSTELTINSLIKYKTSENLCISGGCALNGYINEEILKRKIYKKIHVPPAASDEGQSIGCALHALYNLNGIRINFDNPKKIIYLGEQHKLPADKNINYMKDDKLFKFISKKISEGYVIGWYQGCSESGPRALGNRSILADPRNSKMKNHLNRKIKRRGWFRPFAPSILREEIENWFEVNGEPDSPYMTRIMKYKNNMEELVPAVNHNDNTARIQTVTKDINPRYYKLIKEFFKLTNIPILLNTSFNGNNEPIVETPEDAMSCFEKNNIDILVLENYVYYRNNDENIKPFIEESNVDGNDR